MNHLKFTRFLFFFLMFFIILSCDETGDADPDTPDPVDEVDPLDTQAALFNGVWTVKDANSVTKDGTIVNVFTTMKLTVSGGTKDGGSYSTDHSEESGTEVWPNSGTWTFQNDDKAKILRSDGVSVSISLTENSLRASFTVSGGVKDGNWVFDFVK